MSNTVLRFKISGATMFSLPGDHALVMPPHSTKSISLLESHGVAVNALVSVFDTEHVHEITLPNVEPRIPKRRPEWSDSFFEAVCAEAYRETIDRRREADELRRRIKALIASKSISEIVEDVSGFMDDEPLSDAELAVADKFAPAAKASK